MPMTPHTIATILLRAGAVLLRPTEPFTFASGLRSPVYCDNRSLLGNVEARNVVTEAFLDYCSDADSIAGPATGGIPWAAWVADRRMLPMAYVRGSAKAHGRGRQVEGAAVANQRVVLLEDTISTGESALDAAAALRAEGAEVLRCVCIFTWGWETTTTAFADAAIPMSSLTTLSAVLDVATTDGYLSPDHRALVEAWSADPQGWAAQQDTRG